MKKTTLFVGLAFAGACLMWSCGGEGSKSASSQDKTTAEVAPLPAEAKPNYRIVNFDTICAKYNLAIDFTEQLMRLQNNYDAQEKKLGSTFQSRYNTFMQKQDKLSQERVQLPSEIDALQKEGEQLQSYYQQSQESLAKLQVEIQKTMVNNSKVIMDSVQNYLKNVAVKFGYEAIFFSESVPYYHPSLDITAEVVEGLNAAYNKVK